MTRDTIMKRIIVSRGARLACACAFACATAGCTIAGQIKENEATQQRVDEKTVQLQEEESLQRELEAQTKQLDHDLAKKQMTADQLDARLAALQKRNQQLAHANDQKRHQREELARVLAEYRTQVRELKTANEQAAEKGQAEQVAQQQKLDALRQRLRVRLAALEQD